MQIYFKTLYNTYKHDEIFTRIFDLKKSVDTRSIGWVRQRFVVIHFSKFWFNLGRSAGKHSSYSPMQSNTPTKLRCSRSEQCSGSTERWEITHSGQSHSYQLIETYKFGEPHSHSQQIKLRFLLFPYQSSGFGCLSVIFTLINIARALTIYFGTLNNSPAFMIHKRNFYS